MMAKIASVEEEVAEVIYDSGGSSHTDDGGGCIGRFGGFW